MAFSKRKIVPKRSNFTSSKQSSENSFSDSEEEDPPIITPQRKITPLPKGGAKAPPKKSIKVSSSNEEEVETSKKKPIPKVLKKKESSSEEEEVKPSKKKPIPKVIKKKENSSSEEEEEKVKPSKKKPIPKVIKKKEEEEIKTSKKKPIPKKFIKVSSFSEDEEDEEEEVEVIPVKTSLNKQEEKSLLNVPSVLLNKILSFLSIKERAQVAILNSFAMTILYSLPLDISSIRINYSDIQTLLQNHPTLNLVGLNVDYSEKDNLSYLNPILFKILDLSLGSIGVIEKSIDFLWRCNNLKCLLLDDKIEDLAIVGNLTSLTELDISKARTQTFPHNLFGKLVNLRTLSVDVDEDFPIVASITNLPVLTKLTFNGSPDYAPSFTGCSDLKELYLNFDGTYDHSFSFVNFDPNIRLETLELDAITPSNLAGSDKINTLQRFKLYGGEYFDETGDLLDFLANNPSLTFLEFFGLTEVKLALFSGLNKLTQLVLHIHNSDYEMGSFPALTDLELELDEGFDGNLILPSTLTKLKIEQDSSINDLSVIANCVNLVHLDMNGELENINDIANFSKLKTLSLSVGLTKNLAPLNSLFQLEELHLSVQKDDTTKNFFTWKDINKLDKLRILNVNLAGSDLSSFKGMKLPSLKKLFIYNSPLKTTEGLDGAPSIEKLTLYGAALKKFVLNSELLFLKELIIEPGEYGLYEEDKNYTLMLKDVSGLAKLPVLERLVIQKSKIEEIDILPNLTSLRELDLFHNKRLTLIGPLKGCTNLEKIDLSSCSTLKSISSVRGCSNLEELHLGKCTDIKHLKGLEECTALRLLDISDMSGLTSIKEIFKCTNLETLVMMGLSISSLVGIHRCKNLQFLNLRKCKNIEDISPVSKLRNIQILKMGDLNCTYEIKSLAKSKSLIKISVEKGKITDLREFIEILERSDEGHPKYLEYEGKTIRLDDNIRRLLLII